MADPTDNEYEPEAPEPKKNWRKELEERAAAAEKAQVEMAQELALFKSGLVDLSDDQRDDVLTLAKAKGDTSPEALKAIAERLSFTKPAGGAAPAEEPQEDLSSEVSELANLAGTADPHNLPVSSSEAVGKALSEFQGSQEEYVQFLYRNADVIAP